MLTCYSRWFAAVSVLEKMLLLDPEQRVSASEALELPYFTEFRDTDEETEALPYDQTMDNTDLPLDQWKRKRKQKELCCAVCACCCSTCCPPEEVLS